MICPYCQQEMHQLSHSPSVKESVEIRVWECINHSPVVYRMCTTDPHMIDDKGSIIVPIKERWYCVNLNSEKGKYTVDELSQQHNNPANFSMKQKIIQVPDSLNLTPDNAIDKLKTILVFM